VLQHILKQAVSSIVRYQDQSGVLGGVIFQELFWFDTFLKDAARIRLTAGGETVLRTKVNSEIEGFEKGGGRITEIFPNKMKRGNASQTF